MLPGGLVSLIAAYWLLKIFVSDIDDLKNSMRNDY